jgi:hypothetical protein
MLHLRHGTSAWWRYVASQLVFASSSVALSEMRGEGDVYLMPAFYRHLRAGRPTEAALDAFGAAGCRDITLRCRLLRSLPEAQALAMIGAMHRTLEEIVDAERPDVFISFMIDYYVMDVLERVLRQRGIPFVGINGSLLTDQIMLTARGEYTPLREPSDDEVEQAVATIVDPTFIPTYIGEPRPFTRLDFARNYLYYWLRSKVFDALRLYYRDPLNFRYLASSHVVPDYRLAWRDREVLACMDQGWRQRLDATPFERRVFVGLQVNPECSTDYWVPALELIDYPSVLDRLAEVLGQAGYVLFVKDHPAMRGLRRLDVIERLARFPSVCLVPYEVPGQYLIHHCQATFTWTGNIGLQAALAGRCAIAAEGAFYLTTPEDPFVVVRTMPDLEALPAQIAAFEPAGDLAGLRRRLVRHVLRACTPGEYYTSWRRFSPKRDAQVRRVAPLIASFNEYVPRVLDGTIRPGAEQAARALL